MLWPFLFREIGMWIVSPSWAWVPTPRESHPFLCRPDPRARATGAGNQINSLRPNLFLPLPLRFFSFRSLSSQLGHRQPLTPLSLMQVTFVWGRSLFWRPGHRSPSHGRQDHLGTIDTKSPLSPLPTVPYTTTTTQQLQRNSRQHGCSYFKGNLLIGS